MSEVKWIKIVTDIFDDEKMYAIETLPDGLTMEVVWFKILCLAGKCNSSGFLSINSKLAYTDEMLAKVFRLDIGVVQRALEVFQRLDMIEMVDNAYMVSNWLKYQSGDKLDDIRAKGAKRQREFRERQKQKRLEQKENKDRNVTDNVTNNVTSDVTVTQNCSYSNSISFNNNNTNVVNLNSLVSKESNYKYSLYILNNKELLNSIIDWMEYKDNKKPKTSNHYDTEKGMCKFLTMVVNHDKDYGTDAVVKEIDKAIGNGWQGVSFDNLERYGKKNETNKSNVDDQMKRLFGDMA